MSILNYVRDAVSGMSGGFLSNLILHPFDLVRNRLAVADGKTERPVYRGSFSIIRSIVRNDGWKGLYRGVSPSLIGASLSWGLYFPIYNKVTDSLKKYHGGVIPGYQYFFCGCISGAAVLTLTNPIWVTKTQQCLQYEEGKLRKKPENMFQVLRRLYNMEGLTGLYRGYSAGLLGTIHGGVQFYILEWLKRLYVLEGQKQTHFQMLFFPALSKVIAGTICYPQLLIRSRMQDQHRKYNSLRDCLVLTFRNEGIFGFYKGLTPNLLRTIPASVITFYTYELIRSNS